MGERNIMSLKPKKGFFISSYHKTLEYAKEQLKEVTSEIDLDRGLWQLWHIETTEHGMNYVITFYDATRKYKEQFKETYLELVEEIDTNKVG